MTEPIVTRLNKHLALQLGVSRREADLLIEQGKVSVNGIPAILGARINSGDTVTIKGKTVKKDTAYRYILFNKPVGYVCSRRAQGENPTIYSLLPAEYHVLKPVGRLDRDSSGLMLLTNDGDFAYRMTHPKFVKTKIYHVQLDHSLAPLHQQMISDYGVQLEDGTSTFIITRLDTQSKSNQDTHPTYEITMHEGRNRQIRRTFAALGYTVTMLHRTNFGNYSLGDMKPGELKIVDMH